MQFLSNFLLSGKCYMCLKHILIFKIYLHKFDKILQLLTLNPFDRARSPSRTTHRIFHFMVTTLTCISRKWSLNTRLPRSHFGSSISLFGCWIKLFIFASRYGQFFSLLRVFILLPTRGFVKSYLVEKFQGKMIFKSKINIF